MNRSNKNDSLYNFSNELDKKVYNALRSVRVKNPEDITFLSEEDLGHIPKMPPEGPIQVILFLRKNFGLSLAEKKSK